MSGNQACSPRIKYGAGYEQSTVIPALEQESRREGRGWMPAYAGMTWFDKLTMSGGEWEWEWAQFADHIADDAHKPLTALLCRRPDSNRHGDFAPTVFETAASTIPPLRHRRHYIPLQGRASTTAASKTSLQYPPPSTAAWSSLDTRATTMGAALSAAPISVECSPDRPGLARDSQASTGAPGASVLPYRRRRRPGL